MAVRRFLLLQVRSADDPMGEHERAAFRAALGAAPGDLDAWNLLDGGPGRERLKAADMVLVGGSEHSVAEGREAPWITGALGTMESLVRNEKPAFASCWGFQALARALGGRVVTDPDLAELGVLTLRLTGAGARDPLFADLGPSFRAVIGHEDSVAELPPGAVGLASSPRAEHAAFAIPGVPLYATQFHPELDRAGLAARLRRYPRYRDLGPVEDEDPTPAVGRLLRRAMETMT